MSDFEPTTWRLIHTPPARGAWNMAVDEAILEAVGRGEAPPTLRLYAWQPPCLSLGYAQPASDADQSVLEVLGWELVRRPTGGRAILHTDELTYAVIAPHTEPRLSGGVLESYRTLAQALLRALHLLGIPAQAAQASGAPDSPGGEMQRKQPQNPVCFDVPSDYEITVDRKKLVGSAQARRKEGILQHGSLPLNGDLTRITQALVFPNEADRRQAAQDLLAHATTAEAVLEEGAPSWPDARRAFAQAFQETLNLELNPSKLSPEESRRADQLVEVKYAHPEWIFRV
jgi:lipoate-protein ligase A